MNYDLLLKKSCQNAEPTYIISAAAYAAGFIFVSVVLTGMHTHCVFLGVIVNLRDCSFYTSRLSQEKLEVKMKAVL